MDIGLETLGLVTIFAAFQSVAGVGLLLFGTPSLILLGYSFPETLAIVVPASLSISLLQLAGGRSLNKFQVARTVAQTVPSLITGLAVVLLYGFENQLHLLIAAALAFAVVLQIRLLLGKTVLQFTRRFEWVILSGIGFLHGLTNLGGGFLAAYSSLSSRNRVETRSKIALGYSVFAVAQIAWLSVFWPEAFSILSLYSTALAALVYLVLGRRLFAWTTEKVFQTLMPIVTSLFCISVLLSST